MKRYGPSTQQLVLELFVRAIGRSRAFYERLGFAPVEDKGDFVALAWEGHLLFLDERSDLPEQPRVPQANLRIMVPDVERYWAMLQELHTPMLTPIADRDYGIRDFTALDPDGFGVRVGTWLPGNTT